MDANFENGTEVTFNIFKPGSFFPTTWAIGGVDNSYSFISMGETEVFRAPKEDFLTYLKSNPEILFDLTQRLLVGMDGLLDGFKNVIRGSAREKVLWAVMMLAKRGINTKLTHQDIARLAVVTRETASVEIKKLEKEKIISFKKGIIEILNPKESSL
jgi:CRP/FNR family transcriptional regulator